MSKVLVIITYYDDGQWAIVYRCDCGRQLQFTKAGRQDDCACGRHWQLQGEAHLDFTIYCTQAAMRSLAPSAQSG